MKRILLLIGIIVIIVIGGFLIYKNSGKKEISMPEKVLIGKKIAIIIAFKNFQDEEYLKTKNVLAAAGAEVITVSSKAGTALGAYGGEADVDLLLEDLKVADYDAVLFIGGSGATQYLDDETCHQIAREAVSQNKVLGAICVGPTILAKAGVLQAKKATVWSSPMDKSAVRILEKGGAIYQENPVVVDGKIVTGNGPLAVHKFATSIIELLK